MQDTNFSAPTAGYQSFLFFSLFFCLLFVCFVLFLFVCFVKKWCRLRLWFILSLHKLSVMLYWQTCFKLKLSTVIPKIDDQKTSGWWSSYVWQWSKDVNVFDWWLTDVNMYNWWSKGVWHMIKRCEYLWLMVKRFERVWRVVKRCVTHGQKMWIGVADGQKLWIVVKRCESD